MFYCLQIKSCNFISSMTTNEVMNNNNNNNKATLGSTLSYEIFTLIFHENIQKCNLP
jgi:hypothetical protein